MKQMLNLIIMTAVLVAATFLLLSCKSSTTQNETSNMDSQAVIDPKIITTFKVNQILDEKSTLINIEFPKDKVVDRQLADLVNKDEYPALEVLVSYEKEPTAGYEVFITNHEFGGRIGPKNQPQGFITFYGAELKLENSEGRVQEKFTFRLKDYVDFNVYDGRLSLLIKTFAGETNGLRVDSVSLTMK